MNVRRPGFQLLSLAPVGLRHDDVPTYKDVPCLLPDQLRIYLSIYLPLLALSIILVCLANVVDCLLPGWRHPSYEKLSSMEYAMSSPSSSSSSSSIKFEDQDDGISHEDSVDFSPDYTFKSTSYSLPSPITTAHRSARASQGSPGWRIFTPESRYQDRRFHLSLACCMKALLYSGRSSLNLQRRRRKNWLTATIRDIRDIAVFPIGIFVIITWRTIAT